MNLDDKEVYKKLDKHFVADSISTLSAQMKQVMTDAETIDIPSEYGRVNKVVLAGMGGSNLGIRMIRNAFADSIKVPININAGYGVPGYVDENTLYIISSYSGTTEEPLSTYTEAKKRGAKIIAITEDAGDSKLKKIIQEDAVPSYIFKPENNPSEQPRLGLGYSIMGIVAMLAKIGIIENNTQEIDEIISFLETASTNLDIKSVVDGNIAKKIATQLENNMPILVGAEFLSGNLHIMRNQINETAKTYSSYLVLPDLNHYAMEGLVNPVDNKKSLSFVFFSSSLYSERIQKRLELTKDVVKKNGIEVLEIQLKGTTKKAQCFELLQFGSWLSYYMGIMYEVDPVSVPWVDWFKEQLG